MAEEPDHFDITVGLGFQAAAGAGAVQTAVDVDVDVELQQVRRRVAGTAGGFRLDAGEAGCREIETIDKGFDEPDGSFRGNVIVEGFRQQKRLRTVMTGEVRHGRMLTGQAPRRNPLSTGFHTVCRVWESAHMRITEGLLKIKRAG